MSDLTNRESVSNVAVPDEITELVRGEEATTLVEKLEPIVQREDVALDLSRVERVDAAGLAALITLYRDARKAGHQFRVTRPGRQVRQVLGVVGLDRLLSGCDSESDRHVNGAAA